MAKGKGSKRKTMIYKTLHRKHKKNRQYNGQTNNRGRTDNTMAKQIIEEEQTIQWPKK
jgi:hypothetical protein